MANGQIPTGNFIPCLFFGLREFATTGGNTKYGSATLNTVATLFGQNHANAKLQSFASIVATASRKKRGVAQLDAVFTIYANGQLAGYYETLTETITLDDFISSYFLYSKIVAEGLYLNINSFDRLIRTVHITDNFTISLSDIDQILLVLKELVKVSDTLQSSGSFNIIVIDSKKLDDKLVIAYPTELFEDFVVSHIKEDNILFRLFISELLKSSSSILSSVIINSQIYGTISVNDNPYIGLLETLNEDVDLTILSSILAEYNNEAGETIEATAQQLDQLLQFLVAIESIEVDDTQQSTAAYHYLLSEVLDMNLVINLDDQIYTGWTINPENYAVTNYRLNFTESALYQRDYLMGDSTGLYIMSGETTDKASITTASLDFDSDNLKQVPQVLLGTDGTNIILQVSIDGSYTTYYTLQTSDSGLNTKQIKIGKGLVGRNWQFNLTTENSLNLDTIEFYPIVFKRKH